MGRFESSRLKIEWADQHIARLKQCLDSLVQSDTAIVQINPNSGNEVIKHDIVGAGALRDRIALTAGDAVHNLKCALDYAWIEVITKLAPGALGKFAKFPVYPTSDALKAALCGNGIDQASSDLFDKLLTEIQPYNGGDFAIWPVHRLDIRDKHRLLIPTIFYSSISGIETENQAGEFSRGGTFGTHQEPPWYIDIPLGLHVKNNGEVSIQISFQFGDARAFLFQM